jgi:hypothetical protein
MGRLRVQPVDHLDRLRVVDRPGSGSCGRNGGRGLVIDPKITIRRTRWLFALMGALVMVVASSPSTPQPSAAAAIPMVRPTTPQHNPGSADADFDGDGFADLTVGGGLREVGDSEDGVVVVVYGSSDGLTAKRSQSWSDTDFGGGIVDSFGAALATGDFDGDGFTDLAVGISEASIGSMESAGQIRVVYGSPQGLSTARSQVWSQDSRGVAGRAGSYDEFGVALVAADFGRGRQDDLAVGVHGEHHGGAVNVLFGSPRGLSAAGDQMWSQASKGIAGKAEEEEGFGWSLAAGHFAGGQFADLVVGVPGDRVGRVSDAGALNVINGSASGLTATGNRRWTQNSAGISGRSEQGDGFGLSIATGSFDGSGSDDLAIGAPYENGDRGAVNVIYGSAAGLSARGEQIWSQESKGIAGKPERNDAFGWSITTGNFGHDYGGRIFADLAVRVPGELVADKVDTELVEIIYGSRRGLISADSQALIRPASEDGWTVDISSRQQLSAANYGNDSADGAYDDLVMGRLWEVVDAIYGSGSGLSTHRAHTWSASDLGHPEVWFGFGDRLAS